MTEEEFLAWVDDQTRAEWVEGEVIVISPVNAQHDDIQGWLYSILRLFAEEHDLGQVRGSELAIRFGKPPARRLADLFFISKEHVGAMEKNCFHGAPDLVVEIVSPDSTARDYREKLIMYEAAGVREYWIIDPLSRRMEINELARGKFRPVAEKKGALHSKVLKGFFIRPEWLWQSALPKVATIIRELGSK